ncbi:MAG: hypothetical protein F4X92_02970 [Gammaproteobacteria bacterium]|nr:hypothetical protein [Gammaproteobacteria bacterium]
MALNPVAVARTSDLNDTSQSPDHDSRINERFRNITGSSKESSIQIAQASGPRERFIEEYRRYLEEIEPQLAELNLHDWAPIALSHILEQVESAREQFQIGDYQSAYISMNNAIMDVDAISDEYQSRLASFIENANQAYREGRFQEAGQQINGGLRLDADHVELTRLQSRLQVVEQVNQLLIGANQAKMANRKDREFALLEKILRLDPRHPEAKKRIEDLTAEKLHQAYSDAVATADRALDDRNIQKARKHMQMVNQLKPGNQDVKRLQDRILEIEAEQKYLEQIMLAITAVVEDDWFAAVGHYEQALKMRPFDAFAAEGLGSAKAMIGRIESLKQALKYEKRFVHDHSVKAAHKLLTDTEPFLDHSEQLRELHFEIMSKLEAYNMETEVTVISDNKTNVVVKGVGIVGSISRHAVLLKPGDYQFEGARDGYKSIIVPVTISPGDGPIEVEVICSERI